VSGLQWLCACTCCIVGFLAEFLRRCGRSGGGYCIAQHLADAVEAEELAAAF